MSLCAYRFEQPLLDGAPCISRIQGPWPGHQLALRGYHALDDKRIVEFKLGNGFEALLQMRLDSCWILCFSKDLQELVIAQKEKARKVKPVSSKINFRI